MRRSAILTFRFFNQRIPFATRITPTGPATMNRATGLADKDRAWLRHEALLPQTHHQIKKSSYFVPIACRAIKGGYSEI
jgi:hypothetical protein